MKVENITSRVRKIAKKIKYLGNKSYVRVRKSDVVLIVDPHDLRTKTISSIRSIVKEEKLDYHSYSFEGTNEFDSILTWEFYKYQLR